MANPQTAKTKQEKLAVKLRENLKKRKSQTKSRAKSSTQVPK